MEARSETVLMFVSHPVAGVHRIPAAWLDGYAPSGFHPATAAEIREWYEERGLALPDASDVDPAADTAREAAESRPEAYALTW